MSTVLYYGCGINSNHQITSLIPTHVLCCPVLFNPHFDSQGGDINTSKMLPQPVHISLSHVIFRLEMAASGGRDCAGTDSSTDPDAQRCIYGVSGFDMFSDCSIQTPIKSSETKMVFSSENEIFLKTRAFTRKLCLNTNSVNETDSKDLNSGILDLAVEDNSVLMVNKNGELFQNGLHISLPNLKIEKVCVGKEHFTALTSRGEVLSWGNGMKGQLGNGELIVLDHPERVQGLDGLLITSIESGGWHSLALSDSGDAYVWGWNDAGQLGVPSRYLRSSGVKWDYLISHHNCQCKSYRSNHIQRKSEQKKRESDLCSSQRENSNLKSVNIQLTPLLLDYFPLNLRVKKIACGDRHTVFLLDNGTAWTCGWNMYGQLGLGCITSHDEPKLVMNHVEDIFAGGWNTIFAVS